MRDIHPCSLTIAGSDSGGNAGVQADLRAFHAYGLHGCTVFAALTAQNPFGVKAIHSVPPDFIAAQLDAVLGVYAIRALKTGMLADPVAIEVIAERLKAYPEIAKVIDPVMIATSGASLTSLAAVAAMRKYLMPLATLITPNLPEAELLAGVKAPAKELARRISGDLGCAVLVKGGHALSARAIDVLVDANGEEQEFELPRIEKPVSTHGTGCSLAAALAAELALGHSMREAIIGAKRYVHTAIANSYWVGQDCGVLGFVKGLAK